MADKENKVTQDSKVDKATTEESKAAEKVAKAAKGSKEKKPNFFARSGKSIKRFFKDFKGETKKIVWPDAKTVLKNTGVVLVVVAIVTAVVFLIDYSLGSGISGLKKLAVNESVVATNTDAEGQTEEETTAASEEETTASEEETTVDTQDETSETSEASETSETAEE